MPCACTGPHAINSVNTVMVWRKHTFIGAGVL
jgi:hypothetical protein